MGGAELTECQEGLLALSHDDGKGGSYTESAQGYQDNWIEAKSPPTLF